MKMTALDETDVDDPTARRVVESSLDIALCAEYDFGLYTFDPPFFAGLLEQSKSKPRRGNLVCGLARPTDQPLSIQSGKLTILPQQGVKVARVFIASKQRHMVIAFQVHGPGKRSQTV